MTHLSETVASWEAPDERADISREGVEKKREESRSKAARLQPHVSRLRYHILHTIVSMSDRVKSAYGSSQLIVLKWHTTCICYHVQYLHKLNP
jgi:hypothetical protein